jgi:DNA-binding NtrC family response regulator
MPKTEHVEPPLPEIVGTATAMQDVYRLVRLAAPRTTTVLLVGETGTGKEVIAKAVHKLSKRADGPFIRVNCGALHENLLESELFGHVKGSFTGAVTDKVGRFEAAHGGTIFLDEINSTSPKLQVKLLRVLQEREFERVGESKTIRVDVRVIAATNADLDCLISAGRFREDLFYRLNIVRLHVPPLRERRVEIPALAHHYLHKAAQENNKGDLRLAEETMEYLVLYRWPGNVRQLANEMRRLAALAETGAVVMPEHLTPEITASRRTVPASERMLDATEVVVRLDQPMAAAVRHLEQVMVQYALKKCEGRIEDTATMLGLSRKGLYLKRQRFGIEPPDSAAISVSA